MKESGKKLSKREGDASYEDLINMGYLKEAVINYITLLGWSPGGEREIFSLDELIEEFSLKGISKSPAIFDMQKLSWLNGEYIRNLSIEDLHKKALPYYEKAITRKDIDLFKVSKLIQTRIEKLTEIPEILDFIDELPEYEMDLYSHKKMKTTPEMAAVNLKEILPILEDVDEWNEERIHDALFALIERLGVKNGQILWPLRVAVSGKQSTPGGGIELAELLGKDETIRRIKKGIELL